MEKKEQNDNKELNDFNFILERSETIDKINIIDNKVKEINYTYLSESDFSDEILYYLTQKIDKINQYKYNLSLKNLSSKNNFKITNVNYTTEIDAINQYEYIKKNVHYNPKAFNVHEHRKIPYEEENRQNFRRKFNNNKFSYNNNNNNFYRNNNYNKRNASVDVSYRYRKEENQKNMNEKFHNFRNELNNNYISLLKSPHREHSYEQRKNLNASHIGGFDGNKNSYNNNLTTYNPFIKNLKNDFEDDKE